MTKVLLGICFLAAFAGGGLNAQNYNSNVQSGYYNYNSTSQYYYRVDNHFRTDNHFHTHRYYYQPQHYHQHHYNAPVIGTFNNYGGQVYIYGR